ncbi:hypothetical protein [Streptomyces anulatus]|uniref:hypothetical protein n=1 Tax=Streptomyces anulatus TaxID=1892 RepID=UPI001C257107|nr:hypothetical protein [Streptomyces anulatus]
MTHRNNRQQDRAVRAYKRDHPGITLEQARRAVAARAEQQPGLPARIPAAPLPRPAERLDAYVQRVAAAAGVQRHRAMELLGLEPGTSATDRLDDLAAGLDDHTVRALVAATGMSPEQASDLTTPRNAAPDLTAVRRMTEANFAAGHYRRAGAGKTSTRGLSAAVALVLAQRAGMIEPGQEPARLLEDQHIQPGGTGKTRTDAVDFARLLAEANGQRVLPIDLPTSQLDSYRPVIVDLARPFDTPRPVDPDVFDEVARALGIEQDTPRHE